MSEADDTKEHPFVPLHKRGDREEQSSLAAVLESQFVEVLILILVVCDVIFVIIEAGVDFRLFCIDGHIVERSGGPREPKELIELASRPSSAILAASLLQKATSLGTTVMSNTSMLQAAAPSLAAALGEEVLLCSSPEGEKAEKITHICHIASLVILFIFFLELLAKIYLHGKHFFESKLEILDLFVVTVSLICDVVVTSVVEEQSSGDKARQVISMLLILLRFWRVVRIVHGLYEIQLKHDERTIAASTSMKDEEIQKLRRLLTDNKIKF